MTPAMRDRLRRQEAARRAALKSGKEFARGAAAPKSIFIPDALTRPTPAPAAPGVRPFVVPEPKPAPTPFQLAKERQALQLGVKLDGKKVDPTRQPRQDLGGVPAWVRAGMQKPGKRGRFSVVGDVLGSIGDGVKALPTVIPAIADDLEFLDQYGKVGDLGPSVIEGSDKVSKVLFGRTNEIVKDVVARKGAGALWPGDSDAILGALVLDSVMIAIGPEGQKALAQLARGSADLGDPNVTGLTGLPLEVMMATPWMRGPKYLGVFFKEVLAGKTVVEASNVAKQAYLESRPVVAAYRNIGKAGSKTRIRAADSRTGRLVETIGDALRDRLPRVKGHSVLKSKERLRGEAIQRGARMIDAETTAGARWVERRLGRLQPAATKITPEMQVAVRMAAENVSPEVRKAEHIQWAAEADDAGDALGAVLHQYQADAVTKATRYVDVDASGNVKLKSSVPKRLKQTWDIIEEGSEDRQQLIDALGIMTQTAIARRLVAPKRVYGGARWTRQEKIIQEKLEAIPVRAQLRDVLHSRFGEEMGNLHLALMDAQARHFGQKVLNDPENVEAFYSQLDGATLSEDPFVDPSDLGLPSMPGESQWIPGDEQLDLLADKHNALLMQKEELNDPAVQKQYEDMARSLVRKWKKDGALPENAQTAGRMKKLLIELRARAIEAEEYRLWYENSAQAILNEAGGDVDLAVKIAKLIAIYSPRAKVFDPKTYWNNTGRALKALDEWKAGQPISDKWSLSKNRIGKNGEPLPDWQTIAAQNAMDGTGDWEGIKTNSFYSNFLRSLDEERYAAEFGDEVKKVTIDTWMRRAFRYLRGNAEQKKSAQEGQLFDAEVSGKGNETVTDPMYLFMQDATSRIGDELGWEPHQAQAAIWTSIKAEVEGTPLNDAGLDFAEAIRLERERGDLRAGVQTLFDPDNPPEGSFSVEGLQGPMTLKRFLREEYVRATGRTEPTEAQLRKFEDDFDQLPADDPRRQAYDELADAYYSRIDTLDDSDIPFQKEDPLFLPDDELRQLGLRSLEIVHRRAMRNGKQEDILRIRKLIAEKKQTDPLEQAFVEPPIRPGDRNPAPDPNIETEPAGVYSDPRDAGRARSIQDNPLAEEMQLYAAFARDIARTLPEEEWPGWVKNTLRATQPLGAKIERLGEASFLTPGEQAFFDVVATDGRVIPTDSPELAELEREGAYVFHGTDPDSAAQIMEHRVLKASMAGRTGEGQVWFTDNPQLAARYADAKTYDRGKGDRGVVIVLPKDVLPPGHQVSEPVYGKGNRYFGGSVYTSKSDVFFQHEATPPLEGLPTSAKVGGETWEIGPSQELRDAANDYMREKPWQYIPPKRYVAEGEFDVAQRQEWAKQYEDALDWNDPRATTEYRQAVERSYRAFAEETLEQYRLLEERGYTFEFYPEGRDPYPRSPREAIRDLTENRHMYVYPTEEGYGAVDVGRQVVFTDEQGRWTGAVTADGGETWVIKLDQGGTHRIPKAEVKPLSDDHPLLELVPDVEWGGRPVTWNDLFRAVHDVFGHGKEGFGFRAAGEDMAWRTHAAMYSPEARPAMTMETRGQNSWVNFGPHGATNRTATTADTVFAEQKAALPPATMMDLGDNSHVEAVIKKAQSQPGSVHLLDGSLLEADASGAGAAYGHAEVRVPASELRLFDIIEYRAENAAELAYPQHRMGLWHDEDAGDIVLDVGRSFDDPDEALEFARREGQLEIWDGEKGVPTGITEEMRDEIQNALRRERRGDTLTQREEFQRRGRGTGAILGATDWRSGRAWLWLAQNADASTVHHEIAHYARRFLTPADERKVATWAGAKKVYRTDANGKKQLVGYEWTREAEEAWAEAVTSTLRQGRGPSSASKAINAVAKELRESHRVQDMPDMPPHVAETIMRLYDFERPGPKRGRLWGGELELDDLLTETHNFIYMPYGGKAPVAASKAAAQVDAYLRVGADVNLNRPAEGAAISVRKVDPNMSKEFRGQAILKGDFDPGVQPWVRAKMVEGKIRALQFVRARFLEEASPLPKSPRDIPMKLDPTKDTPPELRELYQRFGFLDMEGGVDLGDLQDIDFPIYDELLKGLTPDQINGRSAQEVALELLREGAQPVEGIVWVPADVFNPFMQTAKAGLDKYGWGAKAIKLTADMLNDYQKALVLFLHPAYVPMQLIGNAGMVLLTQGFMAPKNMWNAVKLHRSLSHTDILKIDSYAGIGSSSVVTDMRAFGKPFSATLGEIANMAADIIPRRAAWLSEARKAGYRTPEDISALLNAKGDDAMLMKLDIAQKARDSIVDFDRLSPLEREVLTRIIWFYPWLRGATRWSAKFALDHPVLAIGLAVTAQYAQQYKQEHYGDLPRYLDTAVPIPGLGDEDNPFFINMRQVFTFTTPYDLANTAWGFVTGDTTTQPLSENLTPILNAALTAIVGYDPYEDKEVPRSPGTFFKKLTPSEAPGYEKLKRIIDPPEQSDFKVFRRDRKQEIANLLFGSIAPVKVDIPAAQRSAAKDAKDAGAVARLDLERTAEKAGFEIPSDVYDMVRLRAALESRIEKGDSSLDKARKAAELYARETGDTYVTEVVSGEIDDEQAQAIYEEIREELFGRLPAIERELREIAGEE